MADLDQALWDLAVANRILEREDNRLHLKAYSPSLVCCFAVSR
jgi:hypothetical protein